MFICAVTKKVSAPRESMIRVVVETRKKEYVYISRHPDTEGEPVTSHGYETVREIGVTREGFDLLQEAGWVAKADPAHRIPANKRPQEAQIRLLRSTRS